MLAIVAMVVFIITAVVAWVATSVSGPHLLALICVGLAFLSAHLAFRVWGPAGSRW